MSRLHRELMRETTSLMLTSEDTDKAYILSAVCDPEAGEVSPVFLLNQVVTEDTVLPLPHTEASEDNEDRGGKMRKILGNLPNQEHYNPLDHQRAINLNTTKARGRFRKK